MPKQYVGPFRETIELFLRDDEWIQIPLELGLTLQEIDKDTGLIYVELPNAENNNTFVKLWNIKAWRNSQEKHKLAKIESAQRKFEWDNLQLNLRNIANRLSEITGMLSSDCMDMASELLRKNPESLDATGVKLVHPYYRGAYTFMPFREPMNYREMEE